ncbi:MAG: LysE family transporter [Nitrososphaeraceae archaeon]|nr:LysE family transporter [Nitrososphaeraceae archaeon]MDW0210089.1 LysE family transporter [Nitrososphaeraceae archaeon]MDW0238542.1 LysE family transporter [Nitrososphaeraceae archaeon]MDW0246792.1 LysE family transporter [Nitrososphaeraceae archaeon]MDW0258252.1 LysE family transporter [Nitrososphaeraceae archaeon]
MTLVEMGLQIILVSVSGVFSPGPLLFANLALSKYGGFWSGIKIAIGHTIIELPVIILLSLPFVVLSPINLTFSTTKIITFIAGAFLIVFGILYVVRTIRTMGSPNSAISTSWIENPYLAGIMFTSLNPFFIVWWTTVGVKLISDSISLLGHPAGIAFLFFAHIWMDYAWLGLSSYLASRGFNIIRSEYHKYITILLTVPLFYYGIYFILGSFI